MTEISDIIDWAYSRTISYIFLVSSAFVRVSMIIFFSDSMYL